MPRTPRKAKKGKRRDRYAALRDEWGRRREAPDRGGGDWLVDKPDLALNAQPFLQTLRLLGYATQDRRYFELHKP